jgi:transcriptional regulator with XRE-family HTH domain
VVIKNRLRAARIRRGLNQGELAKLLDLPPSSISHFENGTRQPSLKNFVKIADALSCSCDYLAGRVDEMKAAGPQVERLFKCLDSLSERDLEIIANFAETLARN